jgi:hypothetical protein
MAAASGAGEGVSTGTHSSPSHAQMVCGHSCVHVAMHHSSVAEAERDLQVLVSTIPCQVGKARLASLIAGRGEALGDGEGEAFGFKKPVLGSSSSQLQMVSGHAAGPAAQVETHHVSGIVGEMDLQLMLSRRPGTSGDGAERVPASRTNMAERLALSLAASGSLLLPCSARSAPSQ